MIENPNENGKDTHKRDLSVTYINFQNVKSPQIYTLIHSKLLQISYEQKPLE